MEGTNAGWRRWPWNLWATENCRRFQRRKDTENLSFTGSALDANRGMTVP